MFCNANYKGIHRFLQIIFSYYFVQKSKRTAKLAWLSFDDFQISKLYLLQKSVNLTSYFQYALTNKPKDTT